MLNSHKLTVMKSAKYFSIFIAICFSGYCYGQKHQITINEFKVLEITEFIDTDGDIITPKKLKDGFTLRIKKTSQITRAEIKGNDGNFAENNLPPTSPSDGTYSKIYKDIKITANADDVIEIQIQKDGETPLLIKLKVSKDNGKTAISGDCVPFNRSEDCKIQKDYGSNFGEDANYYDKNKIVYVYDFNKDPSIREFYKITKDKESNQLKIEVANFNKETLTSGKNVKFKIYNINKFMYNVSIADSVIHFDSEPSALFTRLFLGDSTLLGSLMGTFSDKTINALANAEMRELLKDIKCFVEKYNWLQNKVLNAYDPCGKFPCCYSIEYDELANSLADIRARTSEIQTQLNEKKSLVTKCKDATKAFKNNEAKINKLTSDVESLNNTISVIQKDIKSLDEIIKTFKDDQKDEKKKKEDELAAKKKELEAKLAELKSTESALGDAKKPSAELDKAQKDNCNDDEKKAEIDLKELTAINNLLESLPSNKEIKKVIVFLRNMVDQNNSHTSDYISLNGNMLDLTISIASKDSIFKYFSIPEYKNDPLQIQIPIVGKPFVSFSSGSFIALGKHLQNKTYAWQETVGNNNTADSLRYTLVESGYTLPPMGFCALGNVEWKLSRSFGLGGSAGVGLSIEKTPRMAYLGGLSLFFGDLRQFTVTGGFVGMQINKLTNNFQTVADNQTIYTSKPNIEYYKEFKVGGFISLTYTPFKVYKTKNVKSKNK